METDEWEEEKEEQEQKGSLAGSSRQCEELTLPLL